MGDQPEALRLAEYMDAPLSDPKDVADAAAAELRRLHAECESLRADAERYQWLRDPANAYRDEWNYFGPYSSEAEIDAVIDAAREAK